jgi:NADPH2:quinone reductase
LGHVISYGEAEGPPYPNLWQQLVKRSLTFTRMHLGHLDYGSSDWTGGVAAVVSLITEGKLKVPIEGTFALEEAYEMFAALASRQLSGKALLRIS